MNPSIWRSTEWTKKLTKIYVIEENKNERVTDAKIHSTYLRLT